MTTVDHADSQTFEAVVLLYLASSKLPDGELGDAEAARILELTQGHTAGLAASYGERVVHDVAADLAGASDPSARLAKVVAAAERINERLSLAAKRALIDELRSITAADGVVTAQEEAFVDAAARTFGLDPG